jgi:RNA polymerase sigma factor (sigma-70 family)
MAEVGPSDEELMDQVVRGDQSAFQALYERHSIRLFSMARRITGDSGCAEELLQDTFFQLWQKASRFDLTRGSLIGWLLTITRHRALSRLRRNDYRFSEPFLDEVTLVNNMAASSLDRQITSELVATALANLPKAQLEVISLAYFSGLTCEEIAVRTKTPVGTTKTRLRSALKTMKKTLSEPAVAAQEISEQVPFTLESILITEQLRCRARREPRVAQEAECLHHLAETVANSPQLLVDTFLKIAVELCGAGTAGLSLLETQSSGEQVFRWTNLAGRLANAVGGTTPRNHSPCGVTLDRNSPQLFFYPARYFEYFKQVDVPIVEGLVIPFHVGTETEGVGTETEGTVWIVSHDEESKFDSEDVRIMRSLTEFAACALHLSKTLPMHPPLE